MKKILSIVLTLALALALCTVFASAKEANNDLIYALLMPADEDFTRLDGTPAYRFRFVFQHNWTLDGLGDGLEAVWQAALVEDTEIHWNYDNDEAVLFDGEDEVNTDWSGKFGEWSADKYGNYYFEVLFNPADDILDGKTLPELVADGKIELYIGDHNAAQDWSEDGLVDPDINKDVFFPGNATRWANGNTDEGNACAKTMITWEAYCAEMDKNTTPAPDTKADDTKAADTKADDTKAAEGDETKAVEEKKGCGSIVSASVAILAVVLAAPVVLRKKEH